MTIQVAVANSYGVAMASDRHVFRGGELRSTGQDVKLIRLRGIVPAAMMAAGPLAAFGTPIVRLALSFERALSGAAGEGTPDALAEAVLRVLEQPLAPLPTGDASEGDAAILAEIAENVLEPALDGDEDARTSLEMLLEQLEDAPFCKGGERMQASGYALWQARAPALCRIVSKPAVASALRREPDLCGRAVIGALSRDWQKASDIYLTVGLCCPATGVPVLLALRLWRGVGNRLHVVSRLERDYEAVVRSDRTVVMAQGSGRATIEAMVDGVAEEHWGRLAAKEQVILQPGMAARWDRAHDRIGVSSGRELAAIATGLVRGAEVVGYLTRDSEGTVADVDCILLGPRGVSEYALGAGPALRRAA